MATQITNLAAMLASAANNQIFNLPAGTFILPGPVTLKASGVKIVGNNTTILREVVAGSTSGLIITGNNVLISNVTFDSNKPIATYGNTKVSVNALVINGANTTISNCIGRNIDDLLFLNPTAKNTVITGCSTTNELRGDGIYIQDADGVVIANFTFNGSHNEHGIRCDTAKLGGPTNVSISNCIMVNIDGKETIAVRMARGPVKVIDCKLGSWLRAGQIAPANMPAGKNTVNNLTVTGVHFTNMAYLCLDQGVTAVVNNNIFDGYAAFTPIHVQAPNVNIAMTNNTRQAMPGQKINDPFHRVFGTLLPTDRVVETGTIEK